MTGLAETRTVGRLAPSPTGGLHLGHARTFLLAWLSVRSRGGRVVLRVEDLDASRARLGAAEGAAGRPPLARPRLGRGARRRRPVTPLTCSRGGWELIEPRSTS